jgi:hypothetical protein
VLLNRVLTDEDTWLSYVKINHGISGGLPGVEMSQFIDTGSFEIGPVTFLDGGSLPSDLMLLAGLAEGIDKCRYFEIGTWLGESVATVASRASSCHTLCLPDEEMHRRGMDPAAIASHGLFSRGLPGVTQLYGDSRNFDFGQFQEPFDLIFIDGDHHYDFVKSDTINVFKHLVHERSIVVWHDYGKQPDQVRYEVLAAILDGAGPERSSMIYHVAHTKCAIYTGQKIPSRQVEFPVVPETCFSMEISQHAVDGPVTREKK